MEMPKNIYAWKWKVKPECLEEYVSMHLNPWPDVMAAHSEAGFTDFSIFQNGNEFFYYFKTNDYEKSMAFMNNNETIRKWTDVTLKMLQVDSDVDFGEDAPLPLMRQVFYLE